MLDDKQRCSIAAVQVQTTFSAFMVCMENVVSGNGVTMCADAFRLCYQTCKVEIRASDH